MKQTVNSIFLILVCCLMAACQNRVNKTLLDQAESYLPAFPDSALTLLNQINEKKLTAKEHAQFIFVKTRIEAKKTQVITWQEDMHDAAVYYENNNWPLDKEKAASYYYFSGLAYKWNDQIPAAIVDWLQCAELLEDIAPCRRLFSTYQNLYHEYKVQMWYDKYSEYAYKMLNTARALNDSMRIMWAIDAIADSFQDTTSYDSNLSLLKEELKIANNLNDSTYILSSYNGLAFLYNRFDQIDLASAYADSINQIDKNAYLRNIGMIRQKQGRIAEAVECFISAYPKADLSGKYWMGRWLFDISKQPGFEYLAHYGDSVIYYNEKFDHEEQSGNIEKAIADYKQQRQQEMYHQMIKSFAVAAVIVLMILGISYGWKTWRAKRRIDQLQMLLQEQKAKEISSTEPVDPAELLKQQKESLRLHRELFATTETYRRLQLLEEMKSGEVVNNQMREKLVNQVLAGFYDPIRSLMEGSQFSHEDLFLCLMFYMKFRTRDVAAVLGVSEDAIRKRKSRVRQRMEEVGVELFNEE